MLQMFIDGLESEKQFRQAQTDGITILRNAKGMQKYKPKVDTSTQSIAVDTLADKLATSNVSIYVQMMLLY
jgi:hypothetical protein